METKKEQTNFSETDKKDIQDNKMITLLSYIGILCLIPLFLKKDSRFAKFHAKQGLILAIGWFLAWIPIVGWILWLVLVVFAVWGILNTVNGQYTKLPLVGDLAEKLNI